MSAPPAVRPSVPPPPTLLTCSRHQFPAGTLIHRIHDAAFGPCEFNPGLGMSRFAPFEVAGTKIPTAYGATSLECAIFETIFHDIDATAAFKSVRWSSIESLRHSVVILTRDIGVAALFTPDLMKLGLERSQLIDTPKSAYPQTQAWSPAIYASPGAPEGIVWVSRRYDEEKSMMLFGDRIGPTGWELVSSVDVSTDAATLEVVVGLANRSGVLISR